MSVTTDDKTLNDCGCCDTVELDYPEHYNPPGQDSLNYRLATHGQFLQRMLANLTRDQLPDEDDVSDRRPLAQLTTRSSDDPTIGIMDAWAVVADVLTFYQERIANEGYLRTATERRSVLELSGAIGYELNPGVAASTVLAFTTENAPASPESVEVPSGTQVQSIPVQDQLPQTFETIEDIVARADWNALQAYTSVVTSTDPLQIGTTEMRLNGTNTGLQAGDAMLIMDDANWDVVLLLSVTVEAGEAYTHVTWEFGLEHNYTLGNPSLSDVAIYAFRLRASVFGHNAAEWDSLDESIKVDYLPGGPDTAISADGKMAVSGNIDGSLTVWTIDTNSSAWTESTTLNSSNPAFTITNVAISSNGQKIMSGNAGGFVSLWSFTGGSWHEDPLPGGRAQAHSGQVIDVAFSDDANEAWSRDDSNEATYWDVIALTPFETTTFSSASSAGSTSVVGNADGTLTVYVSGNVSATLKSSDPEHTGAITRVAISSNGQKIISGNADGFVKLWTLSSGTWIESHLPAIGVPAHEGSVSGVALSTDTATIRAWSGDKSSDNKLILWGLDLPAGNYYLSTDDQTALFDNPDGTYTTWILNTASGIWNQDKTFSSADSAGSTSVVGNVDVDGTLTVYVSGVEVATLTSSDPEHTGAITSVAISGDGEKIISGNADGFVKVWEVGPNNDWTQATEDHLPAIGVTAHSSDVSDVALTSDKTSALSRDVDDRILLWDLNTTSVATEFSGTVITSTAYLINLFLGSTADNVSEWPNFDLELGAVNPSFLDLDNVYNSITPGGWVALQTQSGTAALYPINAVNLAWQNGFGLDARITQLELDTPSGIATFDRRTTTVFAQNESLALFIEQTPQKLPIEGDEIELSELLPNLEAEQKLAVSGQRMRATVTVAPEGQEEDELILKSEDGFFSVELKPDDVLLVMTPPAAYPDGDIEWEWRPLEGNFIGNTEAEGIVWYLRDRNGFIGFAYKIIRDDEQNIIEEQIAIDPTKIVLIPAAEDDETISEVAEIEAIAESDDRKRTKLFLGEELQNIYDHDSFAINANVAPATHGETTANEVLGGGNGASINQQFTLSKNPLTYVAAATASGGDTTLEVRVNDVLWQETTSLFLLNERSQAYAVQHDDDSNTIITFGDGIKGARLPSGQENIVATYRSGIGLEGEVGTGSLMLMQNRPLGVLEVSNPLPATGAADPETLDNAQTNAPLTVLTLDRIVSIKDYEDFAATFSGIGKAQSITLWTGVTNIAHITIAAANGDPVATDSALYDSLVRAMDAARDTTVSMQIDSYVPAFFNVKARLLIDARLVRETVEAQVEETLRAAFSFESRNFGQAVTEAEVLAEIHKVEGIIAVDLTALYTGSYDPDRNDVDTPLPATMASWDITNNQSVPAELLLINPGPNGVLFEEDSL